MCTKKAISVCFIRTILLMCYFSSDRCFRSAELVFENRHDRAVVYPPFTVIQFSVGLAVPAQVPNRSIFTNLGIINNVPLPNNVSQFYSPIRTKRMIRKFTHQNFYYILEDIFNSWSFKSIVGSRKVHDTPETEERRLTDCVQRCICQLASLQHSLENRSELLLKMLHFLFLPMKNGYFGADSTYLSAERHGANLSPADCAIIYPSCYLSPLEMILNFN